MPTFEKSKELAQAMVRIGSKCGVNTQAVISDMNQPLGKFVGNALEVYECIRILQNEDDLQMNHTRELSLELTSRMLVLTGVQKDLEAAKSLCEAKLRDGSALEKLRNNIKLQGGKSEICDQPEKLRDKNLLQIPVTSERSGFVSAIDTKTIGQAICDLGGGRTKVEDAIDYQVGYQCEAAIGDEVRVGDALGILFCRNENQVNLAKEKLQKAYKFSEEKPLILQLIKEIMS